MRIIRFARLGAAAFVGLTMSATAIAVPMNFSFTGAFSADDDVRSFSFKTDGSSTVRLISYGYGGGTQADGNAVASGGFDPILSLFDSTGALIGVNDDCGGGVVMPDPVTGEAWDPCFEQMLAAGTYTVSITQYDNFALGPNLSDGFTYPSGTAPNYTAGIGGCSNGQFCDVSFNAAGNNRTDEWALDIRNVDDAHAIPIPLPATLYLMGLGLTILGYQHRKRICR